jgi:2-polyprenyl-3-methyl-5-hydroxy-6-metoxy-1,4-benzoquinol methylase
MPNQFYSSIASHYQYIFPFNPDQIEFLRHVLPYNGARVLDVGCACGDLSHALTHFGFPTWGIDLDGQMIGIANAAKQEEALFPVFEQLDMRKIAERFPESYFDTVICFGNTLVHLLTDDDIIHFINAAFQVMAPEGKLSLQILNYEKIIVERIQSLPLIDNEHLRFERNYDFHNHSSLISFNTKLSIKDHHTTIENTVNLNPITKDRLEQLLLAAGFCNLIFHGSFKREPLTSSSLLLLVTAQKM